MENMSQFYPVISGAIGGAAAAGVFRGPIKTLEDWWFIHFGHKHSEKAEMLKAKQEANVSAYKDKMLEEVSKIEPDNVQEPKLSIMGPALEASKYYIEEETLRNMFAKLLASSMDKSKNSITHTSYVEIIKQMTPLDAQNLQHISWFPDGDAIANIHINFSTGGYKINSRNLYLSNPNEKNQSLISPSLINLERLGLIKLSYGEFKNSENLYLIFKHTEEYANAQNEIKRTNQNRQRGNNNSPFLSGPEIKKGIVEVTPFGKNFCKACF